MRAFVRVCVLVLLLCVSTGGCARGQSTHELAAGVLARGELISLTELANDFDRVSEDIAMPLAGSIVGFLIRREGLDAVQRLWRDAPDPFHPLGRDGSALEAEWRDELTRVSPATLDIPRILVEGC